MQMAGIQAFEYFSRRFNQLAGRLFDLIHLPECSSAVAGAELFSGQFRPHANRRSDLTEFIVQGERHLALLPVSGLQQCF